MRVGWEYGGGKPIIIYVDQSESKYVILTPFKSPVPNHKRAPFVSIIFIKFLPWEFWSMNFINGFDISTHITVNWRSERRSWRHIKYLKNTLFYLPAEIHAISRLWSLKNTSVQIVPPRKDHVKRKITSCFLERHGGKKCSWNVGKCFLTFKAYDIYRVIQFLSFECGSGQCQTYIHRVYLLVLWPMGHHKYNLKREKSSW